MADNSNDFLLGMLAGDKDKDRGFMGGENLLVILLFLMFGRNGFGFGGGSADPGLQGIATRADINEGFALNGLENGIRGLQNGLCDSTFALNNAITSGFHGVDMGFSGLQAQLASCCCDIERSIDGVNYNLATQSCATQNVIQGAARDIIASQAAGTQRIVDLITENQMADLRTRLAQAEGQLSQANQTANIVAALKAPCPVPAYQVPNPNCCYNC